MDAKKHEDIKTLYKMIYAEASFKEVIFAYDYIVQNNLTDKDYLYYHLIVSMHIHYARPFKHSNKVGSLSTKIIPNSYEKLHEKLITIRDRIVVHTDADGPRASFGPINQVRIIVHPDGSQERTIPIVQGTLSSLKNMVDLSKILKKEVEYHIKKLIDRYAAEIPGDIPGEYILNVDAQGDNFLLIAPSRI